MPREQKNPRVLVITPEVTYLPPNMGNMANYLTAKAGGLADVSAALVSALFDLEADVHVAIPDYREIFHHQLAPVIGKELMMIRNKMPEDRVHLAEDRAFFYMNRVYSSYGDENIKIALAFQREVINNIIPRVRPDLIHCNDWMTGLLPAVARKQGIPCLFTVHNIHTVKSTLAYIEDRGIDAAYFWEHLYYEHMAVDYGETRDVNPVDFLVSGIFAAHFVNTVSPSFLMEVVEGRHNFVADRLRQELTNKAAAGCGTGILNAPDPSFRPETDTALETPFTADNHADGKARNKRHLQRYLGLTEDVQVPLFFWPHRLDPIQKGCQLLSDILYRVVSRYWDSNLQIVFVANGEYQKVFRDITAFHELHRRVAVCNFDERLARLAYGGSDFMLMPSRFEPCGLPQMIAPIYGSLPVAHDTGGIHDTVAHLDWANNTGNGFLFEVYDSTGLMWAIGEAMRFFKLPANVREAQVARIMVESAERFTHNVTAKHYMDLYEKMLQRPLITPNPALESPESHETRN